MGNETKMFSTSPAVAKGLTRAEADRVLTALTAHFKISRPGVKWNTRKNGCYWPHNATLSVGPRNWRGVHTVVHEFAHHLDRTRKGEAGKVTSRKIVWRNTRWGQIPARERNVHHGPEFVQALEDCVDALFEHTSLYAWETEYATVKSAHKRTLIRGFRPVTRIASSYTQNLAVAAAPNKVLTRKSEARVRQGNTAWAPPSEANNWTGGCLWRKFKGGNS